MYKRILVPIDGSPTAARGLKEAMMLAKAHKARLRLVHAVDEAAVTLAPEPMALTGELLDELRKTGEQALRKAERVAVRSGIKPVTALYDNFVGRASAVILADAKKWRADLIVMGTHGRQGLSRAVLGSDAEEVVRSAGVPVLLVRAQERPARSKT